MVYNFYLYQAILIPYCQDCACLLIFKWVEMNLFKQSFIVYQTVIKCNKKQEISQFFQIFKSKFNLLLITLVL